MRCNVLPLDEATDFSNFYKCRPEAADDVISGLDVRVKLGDSRLNSGRIIQLFAGRTSFTHSCSR